MMIIFTFESVSVYQWMYLIPVGMIVLNAITQAMNMAEEPAGGQPQQSGAAVQRGTTAPVRRR